MSPRREELPGIVQQRRLRRRFLDELEEGEQLLAEGRMRGWPYVVVTPDRIVFDKREGRVSLRFDRIIGVQEIVEETHRYRLRLLHEPIVLPPERPPLPWDLPAHLSRWERRRRDAVETELRFSRRDTKAAQAIRDQLRRWLGEEALARSPTVRPHVRQKQVKYLVRVGRLRAWWLRRRFGL
jgi:hypothetical protein